MSPVDTSESHPVESSTPGPPRGSRAGFEEGDIRVEVERYRALHAEDASGSDLRRREYERLVTSYYDLVTDFYERAWGQSFHFAARAAGESFACSILRQEHYIALRLGLSAGERVLDLGCGVGGPMREIARFTGAHVTGVNNNHYQVEKARRYVAEAGLADRCELLEADFMAIPREPGSFDAAFAFEATCHAPDKPALFGELNRLLRPGGRVAIYEWCLTERYDPGDAAHRALKRGIEEGNGLHDIETRLETRQSFEKAGFEVVDMFDRAEASDPGLPWYHSLAGRELSFVGVQRSRPGRFLADRVISVLEWLKIAPKGTDEVQRLLSGGADALVAAGEAGIFTPMAFFLARKPELSKDR